MNNKYQIKLEEFEGPLDLLLHLIEKEEMNISEVSLSNVADQFMEYVNTSETLKPTEIADFLVVASKLLLIKSKILLPSIEFEDDDTIDLERQLKIYKEYHEASKVIENMMKQENFTFNREKPLVVFTQKFSPPLKLKLKGLKVVFKELLLNLEPIINLPKDVIRKTISINEKINQIKNYILEKVNFNFNNLLSQKGSKAEVVVSFLAMLELVKQRTIKVNQSNLFTDIEIEKLNEENL
ncbi:segregation/condensation protein A [bacterium]|nr:segregation/condensation protein A [bacterium]MBT4121762.1 segregation/condensation protein A [bacterium]MBT4334875.1 segregation/condensation protein A [bacterium]MBT4495174.1 segregation/condensation protein A [bacterium]MBT4763969.1 segregation/condensation protein A [bacterium]